MKKQILIIISIVALIGTMANAQNPGDIGSVTDIDENVYETVYLKDGKWWMLENLKVTKKPDGTAVSYYYPWNGTENDETLVEQGCGLLYDRDQLMGWPHPNMAQGLCPDGFHVPSIEEFEELEKAYGGTPTRWSWDEDNSWVNVVSVLKLSEAYGGKYDPTGNGTGTGFWDEESWGPAVYLSTNTWKNGDDAHMLVMRRDGVVGAITQDPPSWATNCRCVSNTEINVTTNSIDDAGMEVTLDKKILSSTEQVVVYDITDANDPWQVDLSSVAFSDDTLTISISAFLEVSLGNAYEVRFMDTQDPTSYIGGYNFVYHSGTSIKDKVNVALSAFPNPADNAIRIDAKTTGTLNIYSVTGAQIMHQNIEKTGINTIDISNLDDGLYMLELSGSNGAKYTKRMVKN